MIAEPGATIDVAISSCECENYLRLPIVQIAFKSVN